MTLIEYLSHVPLENVAACLTLKPQRLIFIGDEEIIRDSAERYRRLLREKGLRTQVVFRPVCVSNLDAIVTVLTDIVKTERDCVFDLTGGEELLLMAAGAVYYAQKDRFSISLIRLDIPTGKAQTLDADDRILSGTPASLTVSELIALYGGTISHNSPQPSSDFTTQDIDALWAICCDDPRTWNRTISILNEFESRSIDRNQTYLQMNVLSGVIHDFTNKEAVYRAFLSKLTQRGLIENRSRGTVIRYHYKNPLIRYCLKKEGNLLEVKALLEARKVQENGAPFFDDCRMGVLIDWDGVVHASSHPVKDTRNEIDLMLTRGLTPVFVSCKNGTIEEEELYKLHTVAEQFGGKYARKMLIATNFERRNPSSTQAFVQRAKDMDIFLITDADELDNAGWAEIFKKAVCF